MSQIEIKNLTKKFIQGSNEIYAVNNVSMQIEKGEMVHAMRFYKAWEKAKSYCGNERILL